MFNFLLVVQWGLVIRIDNDLSGSRDPFSHKKRFYKVVYTGVLLQGQARARTTSLMLNYSLIRKHKKDLIIQKNTGIALIFRMTRPPIFQLKFVRLTKHIIWGLVFRIKRPLCGKI